jgi:D-beta-D-heptose 7-phosphate kinase/D-beta-D-heptose 1-phosphate adenosyltransferase
MSWSELSDWRSDFWGRVVFTNGVFDLLHPGHIDLLRAARAAGDALVVGLNSDNSVRRLKGESRPVRAQSDRAYVVAALETVDAVTVFDQDTPLELVERLHPDVIAKGGDYTEPTIVGAAEVRAHGGEVLVIPLTQGQSTTSIIERMRG